MFTPWIGCDYNETSNYLRGLKLLVLGESHYGDVQKAEAEDSDLTVKVVERLAINESYRFFTGITQVISGKKKWEMSNEEVKALWDSVAFYNYVPVYVASSSRIRPTPEMFKMGTKPFDAVCNQLNPDAILVCGFSLWWWLLTNNVPNFEGDPATTPSIRIGDALAARIKHPSSAFSTDEWRPTVVNLLETTRSEGASH